MKDEKTVQEQAFLQWLKSHGAKFPNLLWPAYSSDQHEDGQQKRSSTRSVVAQSDLFANDIFMEIPQALIISEQSVRQHPDLRDIYELKVPTQSKTASTTQHLFRKDDEILTFFLMYQHQLGPQSFYAPYLAILPSPSTICEWTDEELLELHDECLISSARERKQHIVKMYHKIFDALESVYQNRFDKQVYTLEQFTFYWHTIQARTFGRRLPWTALVPFADCLNHQNVQVKYDFNVQGNGCFRMFPTGNNHYPKGSEVFNSYGRRSNYQLLLDYGFALAENEWDFYEMKLVFPSRGSCSFWLEKKRALHEQGVGLTQRIRLTSNLDLHHDLYAWHRVLVMTEVKDLSCYHWNDLEKGWRSVWEPWKIAHEIATFESVHRFLLLESKRFAPSFKPDSQIDTCDHHLTLNSLEQETFLEKPLFDLRLNDAQVVDGLKSDPPDDMEASSQERKDVAMCYRKSRERILTKHLQLCTLLLRFLMRLQEASKSQKSTVYLRHVLDPTTKLEWNDVHYEDDTTTFNEIPRSYLIQLLTAQEERSTDETNAKSTMEKLSTQTS